ncbi:methionine--tRNA ligase [candidate division WOR-1 bacterium RIFCSPLOWO2_02_FULL_46_20]|uniref:Methionine--tRNA ligase n=2 Tax=Saganbacteria TaxID=1703751 RepID=A0A1F4RGQ1_UNCSA|nr:MAG: methionine--tRNA ligase [candidate division WOR-1 bacterium RIFCSPHIGHO2_02_FULL_45_12]OGC06643.1 MAG: methionine--tRNA ligase [candidate division WOR-1 bacterium RIFCSPLOWO2_02_FULL_46_20]OGC08784.1 MAG: methionine--tRNA ligase [candidate division WOR-1 bacterium RIFCSPLOWO2_12_FULL_45_9]
MKRKYYLTTPLYYVNDIPHIGHAYTTIAADVLARYKKMMGFDVYFLTGTDEHGHKIWLAAEDKKETTQKFVDKMAEGFKTAWRTLDIAYDDFLRTTENRHEQVVQAVFSKLMEQGDIYKGEYEGWYCVPCESFWSEMDFIDGKNCPDCGRATEILKEETYFFKLAKYQDKLLKHFEANPDFLQPLSRKNEILQFIKRGLKDLSVTRTAFPWGVGVPGDSKHVVYVWFDALLNYISALGYPDDEKFKQYWPADVQLMGKEIVRFHAVIWPAILMALNIPLPKKIFGHGWWTVEGKKMSKSRGNVVDPLVLSDGFGVDPIRYFLLREVPFGSDGDFSMASFIKRYNSDLANDIGNLLNRTLTMIDLYFQSEIQNSICDTQFDALSIALVGLTKETPKVVDQHMNNLAFAAALAAIWKLINKANKYIEDETPWKMAKAGETVKLQAVMSNLYDVLQTTALLVSPFMPATAESMRLQLGVKGKINKGQPLFPRLQK